jgi:hypothetical protein
VQAKCIPVTLDSFLALNNPMDEPTGAGEDGFMPPKLRAQYWKRLERKCRK